MLSALFAGQQPSETFYKKSTIRPLAKTPRQKVRGSSAPRECGIAPRSRGGAKKKNRGKLKSVRATSGASRPLARTVSTPDSTVSGPLAATARTPDSKVTRQQASSKQCAGKRAASRNRARSKLAAKKKARAEGQRLIAEGAEGACRETDEEHWQRHSLVPRGQCVAVATSSGERWRSSGIFHGVRRALNLWAALGALVATLVLG